MFIHRHQGKIVITTKPSPIPVTFSTLTCIDLSKNKYEALYDSTQLHILYLVPYVNNEYFYYPTSSNQSLIELQAHGYIIDRYRLYTASSSTDYTLDELNKYLTSIRVATYIVAMSTETLEKVVVNNYTCKIVLSEVMSKYRPSLRNMYIQSSYFDIAVEHFDDYHYKRTNSYMDKYRDTLSTIFNVILKEAAEMSVRHNIPLHTCIFGEYIQYMLYKNNSTRIEEPYFLLANCKGVKSKYNYLIAYDHVDVLIKHNDITPLDAWILYHSDANTDNCITCLEGVYITDTSIDIKPVISGCSGYICNDTRITGIAFLKPSGRAYGFGVFSDTINTWSDASALLHNRLTGVKNTYESPHNGKYYVLRICVNGYPTYGCYRLESDEYDELTPIPCRRDDVVEYQGCL